MCSVLLLLQFPASTSVLTDRSDIRWFSNPEKKVGRDLVIPSYLHEVGSSVERWVSGTLC